MDPLLATGAVSLASQLVRNLTAPKQPKSAETPTTQTPRFAELMARASKSPQVHLAQFLSERGLHSTVAAERRLEELSTQVLQRPDVQSFVAGSGDSVSMQVSQDGGVTIRTGDGRERTFSPSADDRKLVEELHGIGAALRAAGSAPAEKAGMPVMLRVTPGVGATLETRRV